MYGRPRVEDFIDDRLHELTSGEQFITIDLAKKEVNSEKYLEALEKYCNSLEEYCNALELDGSFSMLRAQAERIETLNFVIKGYSDSFFDLKHALKMVIEDATECSVDWEKCIDKRNARDLYKSCELCLKDTDSPNKKIRIIAMFYELLAAEESKQ